MLTPAAHLAIKHLFERKYARWELVLPDEAPPNGQRGSLRKNGWTINYHFGEAQGIAFLEYFASHRLTNDTLIRLYADGRQELVGYVQEFFESGSPQAERDYQAHNRAFYEDVQRRGLG